MPDNTQHVDVNRRQQLRIYCPLLPVLRIFIILIIYVLDMTYLDLVQVTLIATVLCLAGFFLTGKISSKELARVRYIAIRNEALQKIPAASDVEMDTFIAEGKVAVATNAGEEEDLSLGATLGTNGIYGIVIGLGISDALVKYVEKISGPTGTITNYFANNTAINQTIGTLTNSTNYPLMLYTIIPLIQLNLSETFRLSGFLITIIPFIHGTILMFSKKWYHDTDRHPHYFVFLLFFIVVFIITIMYFFVGLNILDAAFFIFSLWIVMAFNSVWLLVYGKIIKRTLKKQYLVRREWVLLNLNTLAFLSIFLFASPNLLSLSQIAGNDSLFAGNDSLLNFFILVLFSRILTDYIISWEDFYQGAIKVMNSK
jgi:hypothetical protein